MEAGQKTERTRLKSKLTRLGTKLKLKIGENDKVGVQNCLDEIKSTMEDLEVLPYKIVDKLTEESDFETVETYLMTVQENYTKIVVEGRTWLLNLSKPDTKVESEGAEGAANIDALRSLFALLSLPKVGLEKFDGDVLKFHSFMSV